MTRNLYVLIGLSGSGKTYVSDYLQEQGFNKICTATTRRRREGEAESAYQFVTEEVFNRLDLLEQTLFAGHHYGLPVSQLDAGDYCIVDINGVLALRERYHHRPIKVIGLVANQEVIRQRLLCRKVDGATRMEHDAVAFAKMQDICDVLVDSSGDSVQDVRKEVLHYIQINENIPTIK